MPRYPGSMPRFLKAAAAAGAVMNFASALAAALGGYVTAQALSLGLEREWVMSRSIAEALKSEAFCYLARAQPYACAQRAHNDETLSQKAGEYRDRPRTG